MIVTRRQMMAGSLAALAWPVQAARVETTGHTDTSILREVLTKLHPGLRRYARPEQIDQAISAFGRSITQRRSLGEQFVSLSRLAGLVRCGHTHANFVNQSEAVSDTLFRSRTRLPFHFRWIGDAMVVTNGLRSGLQAGTAVEIVNGIATRTILARLLPLARADGSNDGKRRRLLSVEGQHRIETFDVFHPLIFPFADDRVTLTVCRHDGSRANVRLDCINLTERQTSRDQPPRASDANPGWTLEHHGTASIMTMPGWAMYNSRWDWRGWIAEAMESLVQRDAKALILDLRANEGGNDCGDIILAYLIDTPLAVEEAERRVRYRQVPARLIPYLDTWDRSFDTLGEEAVDVGGGYYRLPPSGREIIAPMRPRFRGRLIVLVGPQNSSATFTFAATVRTAGLGTLIGEETGGSRRGINGGAYYFLRLPESGLELDIPLIGYFPPTVQPDAGIVPDIRAAPGAADLAAGRDPALAAAIGLASG